MILAIVGQGAWTDGERLNSILYTAHSRSPIRLLLLEPGLSVNQHVLLWATEHLCPYRYDAAPTFLLKYEPVRYDALIAFETGSTCFHCSGTGELVRIVGERRQWVKRVLRCYWCRGRKFRLHISTENQLEIARQRGKPSSVVLSATERFICKEEGGAGVGNWERT